MSVAEAFALLQEACQHHAGLGLEAGPHAFTALAFASGRLPHCESLADVMEAIQVAMRVFDEEGSFPAALDFFEGEIRQLIDQSAAAA
jgi:hypothetical protein